MKIEVTVADKNGVPLEIGDKVEIFDWGVKPNTGPLGVVELIWDEDEGRVSCEPLLVEDAHDFWSKVLPGCVKVEW